VPGQLEEVAEAYVIGTLRKEQVIAFEDHYVTCSQCATVLQKTAEYVEAMRAVSKKARSDQK
jgi:anti-sigma-K factor RskA